MAAAVTSERRRLRVAQANGSNAQSRFPRRVSSQVTTLLAQAAESAIREKAESISLALLDRAAAAGVFKLSVEQEPDEADA